MARRRNRRALLHKLVLVMHASILVNHTLGTLQRVAGPWIEEVVIVSVTLVVVVDLVKRA